MILIAHNIRSLHNVGAIFRSADAFHVEKLYLTGFTGAPPRKEIAKTALGSEDRVLWEHRDDILPCLKELVERGYRIVALDNGRDGKPIQEIADASDKIACIVGNEVEGIESSVLDACDAIAEIPMPGAKKSLNVSVAAGIALYAFSRK